MSKGWIFKWLWLPILAVVIFLYNFAVTFLEAPAANLPSRLYAAIATFAGGYEPLEGQPDSPSLIYGVGLLAAIAFTSGSIIAAYFSATREMWAKRRAAGNADITVLGDTEEAAFIASSASEEGLEVFHIGPQNAPHELDSNSMLTAHGDPLLRKAIANSSRTFIVDDEYSTSARIAQKLRGNLDFEPNLVQVIDAPNLDGVLRPPVIQNRIPDTGVISVSDNIGQLVAELLLTIAPRRHTLALWDATEDPGIQRWIDDTDRAQHIITGFDALRDAASPSEADVVILDESSIGLFTEAYNNGATIIALLPMTALSIMPWVAADSTDALKALRHRKRSRVYSIDPGVTGYDYRLLTQTMHTHWARSFHMAQSVLYKETDPWDYENFGREEQLASQAVEFMLANLDKHGLQLEHGAEPAVLTDAEVYSLGRAEHAAWLHRTWRDPATGRVLGVDMANVQDANDEDVDGEFERDYRVVEWDRLPEETRTYYLNVARTVYPGLAALYGYSITRKRQS